MHIYLPAHWHIFVCLLDASQAAEPVSIIYYFILCIRAVASSSPLTLSTYTVRVVWGLCLSLRSGLLCGCSLDRALGIFNNRGCVNVCVVYLGLSIVVCVSLLEDVWGSGCRSGVLIVGIMAAGVALSIGFGVVLNLHFLRKRQFLCVILPDPSTLIQYWRFSRAVMTFPIVFH